MEAVGSVRAAPVERPQFLALDLAENASAGRIPAVGGVVGESKADVWPQVEVTGATGHAGSWQSPRGNHQQVGDWLNFVSFHVQAVDTGVACGKLDFLCAVQQWDLEGARRSGVSAGTAHVG